MKHPITSWWNVNETSQWYVSTTSYWNVVTTSKEEITMTSNQYVSTTSQTSLKWKAPLNWPKIQNGLLWQNNQIAKRENFVTGIKMFIQTNLSIFIVLIWYLPIVNLVSFLPILTYSRYFFCKWFKFCYGALYSSNVMHLTPQNKFLEDFPTFLTPRQPWCQ